MLRYHLLPLPHLPGCLAHHAGGAQARAAAISTGAPLNVKPLPGLLPEHEGGQAGEDAPGQAAQDATLPQAHGSAVGLAWSTPCGAAADAAVSTTVA